MIYFATMYIIHTSIRTVCSIVWYSGECIRQVVEGSRGLS